MARFRTKLILSSFLSTLLVALTTLAALLTALAQPAAAYDRIISLYAGHTDNVIALGGESKLVGVSKNDEPARLPDLPRFTMKASAESLLALRPDLVLMRTLVEKQNPELKNVLERAGVKVLLIDPPSWGGFAGYLSELAPLIGVAPDAAVEEFSKICGEIRSESDRLRESREAPSVFVEATSKELHTCSPDSWAAHVIQLVGGANAAAAAEPIRRGSAIAPWGLERVMKTLSGGLDVYLVQQGPMNRATLDEVRARSWASALGDAKLAAIPEYNLSRPSLLGLRDGGEQLLKIFFGEKSPDKGEKSGEESL